MIYILSSMGSGKWYEGAFQVLYENNYNKVYKIALSITLNEEMAEDAAQEAFFKAFLKIDTLKDKNKFSSWVCTIAINVCRDMLKKSNKNVSLYDEDGYIKSNIIELSDFYTPEKAIMDDELNRELLKYIDELDIDEQRIINMRYYQGLSYGEISEMMNIKSSTVGMKIFRAKGKILKRLKEYFDIKEGYKKDGQGY